MLNLYTIVDYEESKKYCEGIKNLKDFIHIGDSKEPESKHEFKLYREHCNPYYKNVQQNYNKAGGYQK